jgi:hypothetical protein
MNEDLEHVRRARVRSLILLLVVLLVGILVGAAEERYLLQQTTAQSASTNLPRHTYPGALGRMNLTASQRAAIDSVLDLERPRIEAIMQPLLPELHAKADSMRAAVRTVLTPEQQRMFDREPHAQGTELIRRFSKMTAPPDTTP